MALPSPGGPAWHLLCLARVTRDEGQWHPAQSTGRTRVFLARAWHQRLGRSPGAAAVGRGGARWGPREAAEGLRVPQPLAGCRRVTGTLWEAGRKSSGHRELERAGGSGAGLSLWSQGLHGHLPHPRPHTPPPPRCPAAGSPGHTPREEGGGMTWANEQERKPRGGTPVPIPEGTASHEPQGPVGKPCPFGHFRNGRLQCLG